jgi:hypothetical protein
MLRKRLIPQMQFNGEEWPMNCPRCSLYNPDAMNYCGRCGVRLDGGEEPTSKSPEPSQSRFCVSCGKEMAWDVNICQFCGHYYGSLFMPIGTVKSPSWKPVVGGIICLASGLFLLLSTFGFGFYYSNPYHYYYGLLILALYIAPFITIAGGISAVVRKYWTFSMVGGICAIISSVLFGTSILILITFPLSIFAIVLIASSRGEFKR